MINTNNEIYWEQIKKKKNNAKLCFIHTPKCGGTYAIQILKDLNIKNKGHNQANENDGITFTIIRDPVDRFKSLLNYRLGEYKPRYDWPNHLNYVYLYKSLSLNYIVNKMSNREILNFKPYRTLTYWSKNIDIFITINNLSKFLSFFGYDYDENKYEKKNVSKNERGNFNYLVKKRIYKLYNNDKILFEKTVA